MAEELECQSISIPAIATGSFGFPKKKCAKIMFDCLLNYESVIGDEAKLKFVRFVNNDLKTTEVFVDEFDNRLLDNINYV
jgi:putative ATPase